MRTLKKTLCVVLCLVMMVGLCAIGTSAAFTDQDKITYAEAVDVLTGIGVINGMDDGSFSPDGTLNRAQACTIIARLKGAEDIKAKSTFDDVPNDFWAASAIAYCKAEGIVDGIGDNKFDPYGKLTGSAWEKMLLTAIGFDAEKEGMTGASWEVGVAKLVKAKKLDKAIKGLDPTAEINREQACQIAFKALNIGVSGESYYTIPGSTLQFETIFEAYIANGSSAVGINKVSASDSLQSTYFETLEAAADADQFGRPANQWKYDTDGNPATPKEVIYNQTATANKTFTAVAAPTTPGGTTATLLANIDAALRLTGTNALSAKGYATAYTISVNTNGATTTYANGVGYPAGGADWVAGDVIEVYTNTTGQVTAVTLIRYDLYQVFSVLDLTAAERKALDAKIADGSANLAEKSATKKIKLQAVNGVVLAGDIYDSAIADNSYAKGDFILAAGVTAAAGSITTNKVMATKAATLVSGTVSAYKVGTPDQVQIGGTWYKVDTTAIGGPVSGMVNKEYTMAINEKGILEGVVAAETVTSSDYALVYMIAEKAASLSGDGIAAGNAANTYTVYVVKQDGTKGSYPLAVTVNSGASTMYITGDPTKILRNGAAYATKSAIVDANLGAASFVVPYVINAKGAFEIVAAPAGITVEAAAAAAGVAVNKNMTTPKIQGTYFLSNDTEFIFASTSGTKMNVSTKTGYKNVSLAAGDNTIVVYNAKNEASYVFVLAADAGVTTAAAYAVLLDTTPVVTKSGTTSTYTYKVAIDGVETTLASVGTDFAGDSAATIGKGGVFTYTTTDGAVTATKKAGFASITTPVTYIGDEYFVAGSTFKTANAKYFMITYNTNTFSYSVTTAEKGNLAVANVTLGIAASKVYVAGAGTSSNPYLVFIAETVS